MPHVHVAAKRGWVTKSRQDNLFAGRTPGSLSHLRMRAKTNAARSRPWRGELAASAGFQVLPLQMETSVKATLAWIRAAVKTASGTTAAPVLKGLKAKTANSVSSSSRRAFGQSCLEGWRAGAEAPGGPRRPPVATRPQPGLCSFCHCSSGKRVTAPSGGQGTPGRSLLLWAAAEWTWVQGGPLNVGADVSTASCDSGNSCSVSAERAGLSKSDTSNTTWKNRWVFLTQGLLFKKTWVSIRPVFPKEKALHVCF